MTTTPDQIVDERQRLEQRPAYWTFDEKAYREHGLCLYYFAPTNRIAPPYLLQITTKAIVDVASDGSLAGIELVDLGIPPPEGNKRGDAVNELESALAASGNYVADDDTYPTTVQFANGRRVSIAHAGDRAFLTVDRDDAEAERLMPRKSRLSPGRKALNEAKAASRPQEQPRPAAAEGWQDTTDLVKRARNLITSASWLMNTHSIPSRAQIQTGLRVMREMADALAAAPPSPATQEQKKLNEARVRQVIGEYMHPKGA